MKPIFRTVKFFLGIFLQVIVAVAVFLVGWSMSFTSIKLNEQRKTFGLVTAAITRQTRGSKAIPGQMDLIISLDNLQTEFWVYRSLQNYTDLISQLPKGKRVIIYHDSQLGSNGYYTAYQIESSRQVIYSKDEYERKEKLAGRFFALPGAIALLATVVYQIRKRYRTSPSVIANGE